MTFLLALAVALLPVSVFLLALVLMDSFKLVPSRALAQALGAGALAALAGAALHGWLLDRTGIDTRALSRYVAPVTEETLKGVFLLVLLHRRRIGFLVDAAILGFAVGTGFALVENVDYLRALPHARLLLWIVRGFGTAILHGTTSATFAVAAKTLADRYPGRGLLTALPGWAAVVVLHSAFNHALVSPLLAAAILMAGLPMVVVLVFTRSERATREWVGEGLDLDVDLLNLLTSPGMGGARVGHYLRELQSRFPGPVVADMFCLLRIELELAIRAKGMLLARQAGLALPPDPELAAKLREWRFLQSSIGRTGLLAIKPLGAMSGQAAWQHYLLEQLGRAGEGRSLRERLAGVFGRFRGDPGR
jgi:RsiW-degrading membrane proteinase PrsW (M82 family)